LFTRVIRITPFERVCSAWLSLRFCQTRNWFPRLRRRGFAFTRRACPLVAGRAGSLVRTGRHCGRGCGCCAGSFDVNVYLVRRVGLVGWGIFERNALHVRGCVYWTRYDVLGLAFGPSFFLGGIQYEQESRG
jgi:hypothetical protein